MKQELRMLDFCHADGELKHIAPPDTTPNCRLAHLCIWLGVFLAVAEPAKVQVGIRARARRKGLGLTQDELARELGVTHQHISRIEGDLAVPSLDLLVRLSGRLGVSADHLLTGHNAVPPDTAGAIRADGRLSSSAKRHLIGLIDELHNPP